MSTHTRTIQLLEPEMAAGIAVLDETDPAVYEEGTLALVANVAQYNVIFETVKLATDYDFDELEVENTVDESPLVLVPTILERRTDGFLVEFSALPDSANYRLQWAVKVNVV